jgi:hypothetical protein
VLDIGGLDRQWSAAGARPQSAGEAERGEQAQKGRPATSDLVDRIPIGLRIVQGAGYERDR